MLLQHLTVHAFSLYDTSRWSMTLYMKIARSNAKILQISCPGNQSMLVEKTVPTKVKFPHSEVICSMMVLRQSVSFPRFYSSKSSFAPLFPGQGIIQPISVVSLWVCYSPEWNVFTQADACKAPRRVSFLRLCYQSQQVPLCQQVYSLYSLPSTLSERFPEELSPLAHRLREEVRKVQRVIRILIRG